MVGATDEAPADPKPDEAAVELRRCIVGECRQEIPAARLEKRKDAKYCSPKCASIAACRAFRAREKVETEEQRAARLAPVKCLLDGCSVTFVRGRGHGKQLYCTAEHRWEALRRAALARLGTCAMCPTKLDDHRARYCSEECKNAWIRSEAAKKRPVKTCRLPSCGAVIGDPLRRGFCSAEHAAEGRRLRGLKAKAPKISREQREKEAREAKCAKCGGPVPYTRAWNAIGRGWRVFCSDLHRLNYWSTISHENERRRRGPKPVIVEKTCAYPPCGKKFMPVASNAETKLYCSQRCTSRDYMRSAAPDTCDLCEEPITEAWRQKHPGTKVCSDACESERRSLIMTITMDKKSKTRPRKDPLC